MDEHISSYLKEFQEARLGSTSLSHHCHCTAEVVHILTVSIQHHGLWKLSRNSFFFQDKQDDGLVVECQAVMWYQVRSAVISEMLHNHCNIFKAFFWLFWMWDFYRISYFIFKKKHENVILPMPQRHPQSFPGCPTQIRGWLGQFERGSGTARSPSLDRRLFSASCHSAALAQSGTGVSHSADKADKAKKKTMNT